MRFEFDPIKSQANRVKHGIDFIEGQALWNDSNLIRDVPEDVKLGEARWKAIGAIGNQIWSAIYCYREDAIRIISIRKAREDEQQEYEILKG